MVQNFCWTNSLTEYIRKTGHSASCNQPNKFTVLYTIFYWLEAAALIVNSCHVETFIKTQIKYFACNFGIKILLVATPIFYIQESYNSVNTWEHVCNIIG